MTKHDQIMQLFLDNWVSVIIIIIAGVVMATPQLRDGIVLIIGWIRILFLKQKNIDGDFVGAKLDREFLRLLIKANDAIKEEFQNYEIRGYGSASGKLKALFRHLNRFETRYKKDKDVKIVIKAGIELNDLDKESEKTNSFIEPEYEKIICYLLPVIKKLITKYIPQ